MPRHPELVRLTGRHPFNVEPPVWRIKDHGFISPNELHYVRNHGAVPRITDGASHKVTGTCQRQRMCLVSLYVQHALHNGQLVEIEKYDGNDDMFRARIVPTPDDAAAVVFGTFRLSKWPKPCLTLEGSMKGKGCLSLGVCTRGSSMYKMQLFLYLTPECIITPLTTRWFRTPDASSLRSWSTHGCSLCAGGWYAVW